MAEQILNTRIISKHITLAQANEGTWKPYEGEIVLARVDVAKSDAKGVITNVPTYLMKVGAKDAEGNLIAIKDLQWTHAPASDVYNWAKQSELAIEDTTVGNVITGIEATEDGIKITRASVATSESYEGVLEDIDALEKALAQEVADRIAGDENLQDAIDVINNNLSGTTDGTIGKRLTDVEGVASGAASDVSTLEGEFNTYKNTTVPNLLADKVDVSTYTTKMSSIDTSIGTTIPNAITQAANGAKSAVIGASGDVKTADTIYGAKAYAEDVATTKANAVETAAKGYADGIVSAAQTTLQGNIDNLSGTVAANESANSTAHSGFNSRIEALEDKVENVANVMDFVGIGTATVTDGVITVAVEGVTSFQKGDVVVTTDGKEYVYDGSAWHEFGYADDTEAAVANLKEAFETFRDNTVPTTYATQENLAAETTARTTAISELDTAYKAADSALKGELTTAIGTAKKGAYDDAIEEAARLDSEQTTAITNAYTTFVNNTKTAIESAQSAVDSAQNTKITALDTAVGDANRGLVKGLADEIVRADTAEKANAAAIKAISDDYLKGEDKTELANATSSVASDLSTLSGTVTANKTDVDTNFVKVVNNTFTVGEQVIIFDCGGVEEA